jgi:signal transduction histidine kinase
MDEGAGQQAPAEAVLAALSTAVRTVATEASLDRVLYELATSARDLVGARYAAIGVPEPEGDRFAKFVTVGMSDELIEQIGPLPRTHGLLAAMLGDPEPYRTPDIAADPRFRWWPSAHPRMRSFLGVPIVSRGDVIGAFYLTDKVTAPVFGDADEAGIVLLAQHAAIAIDHARLFEDSRELALTAERARLARELHDAMSQSLFSLRLAAETASRMVLDDPERAAGELATVRALADRIGNELRSAVEGLRPADLERDGLVAVLRSQLAVAGRVHGVAVSLDVDGDCAAALDPDAEHQVLRIVQEAVTNALRHADATRVDVSLAGRLDTGAGVADGDPDRADGDGDGDRGTGDRGTGAGLVVRVADDGTGFDPSARLHRSRRLGLASMNDRAEALGGTLTVDSHRGTGTTVELRVPV